MTPTSMISKSSEVLKAQAAVLAYLWERHCNYYRIASAIDFRHYHATRENYALAEDYLRAYNFALRAMIEAERSGKG